MVPDLFCQVGEGLVHVVPVLGTHLQKQHVMLVGHHLPFLLLHLPLMLQIAFGGNQDLPHCLRGVALDLLDPTGDAFEGLFVIDCIGEDDPGCPLVVCLRDVAEALLASGVPDL